MTIDLSFYEGYLKWTRTKAAQLTKNKPDQVPQFVAEAAVVTGRLFTLIQSVAACFRGGFFGIATNVGRWVAANPDPLKETRDSIRAMYVKWGA